MSCSLTYNVCNFRTLLEVEGHKLEDIKIWTMGSDGEESDEGNYAHSYFQHLGNHTNFTLPLKWHAKPSLRAPNSTNDNGLILDLKLHFNFNKSWGLRR